MWALRPIIMALVVSTINTTQSASCRKIQAAFTWQSDNPSQAKTFFLSRFRFVEYSFTHEAEKREGNIRQLGIEQSKVQAAFSGGGNDVIVLKGCSYSTYNTTQGLPLQLVETKNMSDVGLPCKVNAAIKWANQTLVFKGCRVWKLNPITGLFEPNGSLRARQLPCQVDAAVNWLRGVALFIKGHQYWKVGSRTTGPFHTDHLNICSWYICGEADWMSEHPSSEDVWACNGDPRLCPLRLNQVTLPGLHNAGAGFNGGFGLANCWVRNHALNITRQLEIGIRHLDIDPCYRICGLLGTCHSTFCGGSICMMIKQTRWFLKTHRHDVITLNFNHEIVDERRVFRVLTKHLKVQLKPMLNSYFRQYGSGRVWPTLRQSVSTNQRVFVFYAPIIQTTIAYRNRYYNRFLWIHSEYYIGSTWRPFDALNGCGGIVNLTAARCEVRKYRSLVEVALAPAPQFLMCTSTVAHSCRPYLHAALRACQPHRFQMWSSPNIALVDYPEVNLRGVNSVFNAVFHQNIRNVLQHRARTCRISIDAAVTLADMDLTLFFVGTSIVEYNPTTGFQTNVRPAPSNLQNVEASYESTRPGHFFVVEGCQHTEIDAATLLPVTTENSTFCTSESQAAVRYQNAVYLFQGCLIHQHESNVIVRTSEWNIPCNVDAATISMDGEHMYVFKGNNYWLYDGNSASPHHFDWSVDLVVCQGSST